MSYTNAQKLAAHSANAIGSPFEWSQMFNTAAQEIAKLISNPVMEAQLVGLNKTAGLGMDNLLFAQGYLKALATEVLTRKGSTPTVLKVATWTKGSIADQGHSARIVYSGVLQNFAKELAS